MLNLKDARPTWAEVDLNNLAYNIKEVRKIVNKKTLITAVVKADAYGHGSVITARTFLKNGADRLAVATLREALELRRAKITAPILILGCTPLEQMRKVINNNITQTIFTYEQAEHISKLSKKLNYTSAVHIKIDTGMNRIGFNTSEASVEDIKKIYNLENISIEGIFTHFATADEKNKEFTRIQFNKFLWVVKELEKNDVFIPIKHVSNSAAIIDFPEYNLDMVRAGIMLYGSYPSKNVNKSRIKLKNTMTLKSNISYIKVVPEKSGISYGQTYITKEETKIGTLPIGYADGFTRMLSNKICVNINSKKASILGRICMDQCMVDLAEIENAKVGDTAIIFGDGDMNYQTIDDIADCLGTISNEVFCMVGRRVPRVYFKDGQIVAIKNYI